MGAASSTFSTWLPMATMHGRGNFHLPTGPRRTVPLRPCSVPAMRFGNTDAGKAARCPACKQVIHVPAMYMLVPDRPPNTGLFDELYEGPVGAASSE